MPRRTVRLRLTAIYGGLFLVSGAMLLAITYLFVRGIPQLGFQPPGALAQRGRGAASTQIFRGIGSKGAHAFSSANSLAVLYQRNADLHDFLIRGGIALAVTAVLSIWLGWVMAGRVLRPMRVITATTRQISEENLHERLALGGPDDELKELGDTIDGLLGRLEASFDAQRSFVANASHELRTPVTMMRTSLDVAAGKDPPLSPDAAVLAAKVRKGLDQAERLIDGFLALARAQRGAMTDLTTVSLSEIASAALDAQTADLVDRGLTVRRTLGEGDVAGSETLLARMVANIIDNAVRHNEPGGHVEVTTEVDGPTARLIVESGGPLLDQDKVAELVQPFRRLAADRTASANGVGLGLSIVASVAAAHDGSLDLWARPQGGLRVVVEMPRAQVTGGNGAHG